mmetsp:Transcript_29086/g.40163  ORF Transcript_29086/g.40163 Transcript_29086/m.40163 type:complete len:281 (-) Transcript_29086:53-895(-)
MLQQPDDAGDLDVLHLLSEAINTTGSEVDSSKVDEEKRNEVHNEELDFPEAPLLVNLIMSIVHHALVAKRCWTSGVLVFNGLFRVALLLTIKIVIPALIFFSTEGHEPEKDFLTLITGAAGWVMVSYETEVDVLRDIYWVATHFGVNRWKLRQKVKFSSYNAFFICFLSLIYDLSASLFFLMATWKLMRSSESVIDKVMNCAAFTAILYCDEAIQEHTKYDSPGCQENYLTIWKALTHKSDATKVAKFADKCVFFAHQFFALVIVAFTLLYITSGYSDKF